MTLVSVTSINVYRRGGDGSAAGTAAAHAERVREAVRCVQRGAVSLREDQLSGRHRNR